MTNGTKLCYCVYIDCAGNCREVYVDAFTPSQAIALAKMTATATELRWATFTV